MKVGLLKGNRCVAVIPVEVDENADDDQLKTQVEQKHKLFHSPIDDVEFYALSASKAIFRARTYNCNLFSPVIMITL